MLTQVKTELQARLKARILHEWFWTFCALLVITFSLSFFSETLDIKRLEHTLYDRFLSTLTHSPPSRDIVIVAIDDASIADLGFWPWRRIRHAQLLERLDTARVVALDLLLSEHNPAYPSDDLILATAMQAHGRVILPLMVNNNHEGLTLPVEILASASNNLGYINIHPDSDGVVRAFTAQKKLPQGPLLNHLSLAMLIAAEDHQHVAALQQAGVESLRIPYTNKAGSFTIYPYNLVMKGAIPASAFDNKFVLVGSWGSGLGDTFPTPSAQDGNAMAGVEILANILNGSLNERWIHTPGRLTNAFLSLIPILLIFLSFRYLSPQRAFIVTSLTFIGTLVLCGVLLSYTLWWVSPIAGLIGITLAYPLWSWRSQHAALRHIDEELTLLRIERMGQTPDSAEQTVKQAFFNRKVDIASWKWPWQRNQSLPARLGQLHDAIEQMRLAQRHRNETLRFLSHDMRAPLNSILALTQLQRNNNKQDISTPILGEFDRYAQKTLELVDGFVALSRAEVIDLSMQAINLADLIIQCCDDAWVRAHQKHITIDYEQLPATAWVNADAHLLERVWSNLLDNALKYSNPYTTVRCTLKKQNNFWIASIQDQGRGIHKNALALLFTPFQRFDENSPKNPSGAGLGLAFVKTVITRHGGHIDVHSEPAMGTCFRIHLPALNEADSEASTVL